MNQNQTATTNQKSQYEWETFTALENIIFGLNIDNFAQSSNFIISKFCKEYPISYDIIICQMIYTSFLINSNNFDIYLRLLQEIEKYEENNKINTKIINLFSQFLLKENTQESFHLLNYMINYNLLESKIIQNINKPFFVHINQDKFYEYKYLFDKENISYEELSKNDFALHKQLVKEGVNPDEIAKIIRNDEIEKLQEISSQTNFDFNQTIRKSLYERCDFVNKINVSLIDYAAFFSSNKCFKYLLMNSTKVNNTGKYAVAGGNLEIIHLCEQNHSSFENAYETAIVFHRNEIFKYLYENKIEKIDNLEKLGTKCIYYHNYEIFTFLEEKGMRIDNSIIIESAKIGNLFLTKYFLKKYQIPNELIVFSVESGNIEFVRYLFSKKHININAQNIYLFYLIFIPIILYF